MNRVVSITGTLSRVGLVTLERTRWLSCAGQGQYHDPFFINPEGVRSEPGYVTDLITDKTIDFISTRDPSKPFFVMCHHKAPHRSWECDEKHRDLYKDDIKLPETFNDDYKNRAKAAAAAHMRIEVEMTYEDLGLAQPEGGWGKIGRRQGFPTSYEQTGRKVPSPQNDKEVQALRQLIDLETGEKYNFASRKEMAEWKYQRYMKRYLRTIQWVRLDACPADSSDLSTTTSAGCSTIST